MIGLGDGSKSRTEQITSGFWLANKNQWKIKTKNRNVPKWHFYGGDFEVDGVSKVEIYPADWKSQPRVLQTTRKNKEEKERFAVAVTLCL